MADVTGTIRENAMAKRYPIMTGILYWCGLAVISSLYITIPILSVIADAFGAPLEQAAWTGSAFSLAYAIGSLWFGALSDRYGRKPMMLFSIIALSILSPFIGLADSLPILISLRAIQGAAAASFAPAALAYAVEMFPAEKRVTAIGFIISGFLTAGIAGQVFSSYVSRAWGWSSVFYILGGLYSLSAIGLGKMLPRGEAPQRNEHMLSPFKQMASLLLRRPLLLCYLTTTTLLMCFVGMYTALEAYFTRPPYALNAAQMLGVRAAGIIGMLISPVAGRLVARFGTKIVLQAGLCLAAASVTAIGIRPSVALAIMMSVLFVAGISIAIPTLISLIGVLGGEARGAAVTLYTFILFIGATLGPIAALNLLQTGLPVVAFGGLGVVMGMGLAASSFVQTPNRIS